MFSESLRQLSAAALLVALATPSPAQHHGSHHASQPGAASPYAGLEQRDIKALSADQLRQLETGAGMALALAAELNGWPGPMHVLEHADALQLSDEQRQATRALMHAHKQRAVALGRRVIEAERALDRAFAERRVDSAGLTQLTAAVAEPMAALRAEHLSTHLAQTRLLDAQQVARYQQLRGYTSR
jgi:hypothetical protein